MDVIKKEFFDRQRRKPPNLSHKPCQSIQLPKVRPRCYAVLGNHDHWADSKRVTEILASIEIIVLKNENKTLPNNLILAGVDDYWEGPADSNKALAGIEAGDLVILLTRLQIATYRNRQDHWDS